MPRKKGPFPAFLMTMLTLLVVFQEKPKKQIIAMDGAEGGGFFERGIFPFLFSIHLSDGGRDRKTVM